MYQSFFQQFKSKAISTHILYWIAFVMFFGVAWGIQDNSYFRNIMIQICCLPSRMLLVYITIFYLFPKFFDKKQYLSFFVCYFILIGLISILIQRPLFLYFIQPNFLPSFNYSGFFVSSEIINTALDINIAAMVPIAYTYLTTVGHLQNNSDERKSTTEESDNHNHYYDTYITLKVDKSQRKIKASDILYVESLRNYCKIKMKDSEITVLKTLTSIQESLPESDFLRVHRSFLVNKDAITSFSPSKVEIQNITIPVGRKYKDEAKEKLLVDF
jgi:two-component system, LytTR family, response regulator LytT